MEFFDEASFERLTGQAFFTPTGEAGAIQIGNIEMMKIDFGLKSKEAFASVRGELFLRRHKVFGRAPIYSIQVNQFASPTVPLQLLGERLGDLIQVVTNSYTFTFTAVLGRGFELPHLAATINWVRVAGEDKMPGHDYFVDDPAIEQGPLCYNGWILLPVSQGTIVAGNVVSVNYSAPALSLEQYRALATLSRDGVLVVLKEDHFGPPAREKWIMDVTLYSEAGPETHPDKFRSQTLKAAVYGKPLVRKRPTPRAYGELLIDDSTVLDLS